MAEIPEEIKTLLTILRHIEVVREHLNRIAGVLSDRAHVHGLPKLFFDEFSGFIEINQVARKYKYGSPEYKASTTSDAVGLHYSRNSHHPERYPGGVEDMNLFDLIEMVCDWKAASETYGQSSFEDSLATQVDRFKLTPEQVYLIKKIAAVL